MLITTPIERAAIERLFGGCHYVGLVTTLMSARELALSNRKDFHRLRQHLLTQTKNWLLVEVIDDYVLASKEDKFPWAEALYEADAFFRDWARNRIPLDNPPLH